MNKFARFEAFEAVTRPLGELALACFINFVTHQSRLELKF
jgi:hypothetical protein